MRLWVCELGGTLGCTLGEGGCYWQFGSMARAKCLVTNTIYLPQHHSTYVLKRTRPSKTVSCEVNLALQHSLLEVLLLSKFESERGGFQLKQILYFDAVVVCRSQYFLLLFGLALAILCTVTYVLSLQDASFYCLYVQFSTIYFSVSV